MAKTVPMILGIPPFLWLDRMGVIEAGEPTAIRAMESQRVIQPVRLFRRCRHKSDDKFHPMAARRVHHQNLTVKVEQKIEAGVPPLGRIT
jgi:hypothetical protein